MNSITKNEVDMQRQCRSCIREQYALLKASGPKLREYMQGQITQDISLLSSGQGIYAAILTPQGKTVCDLYIICGHHDELVLIARRDYAVALVERLRRFALGYEMRCGIVDALHLVSVQGTGSERWLADAGLPQPGSAKLATAAVARRDCFVIRMAEAAETGYWIITDTPQQLPVDQAVDEEAMVNARIIKGIPAFGIDWDEKTYPLNANLIEFNGVTFDKGCYVGQEVTSRMNWRGGIKKRLYRVQLSAMPEALPAPLLTTAEIGTLTSAAEGGDGVIYGIALLPIEVVESEAPLVDAAGAALTVLEACHA